MKTVINKKQKKSQREQDTICEAANEALYALGYSETTLNKVD